MVGSFLPEVGGMAFRRFGFTHAALVQRWREIVGPLYARWSVPETLKLPRGQKSGAVLTIRVEGPFAVQLQHAEPEIIERVNRIFGHRAVARLKLVHGAVPRSAGDHVPAAGPDGGGTGMPAGEVANVRAVADDRLREALERLAGEIGKLSTLPKVS